MKAPSAPRLWKASLFEGQRDYCVCELPRASLCFTRKCLRRVIASQNGLGWENQLEVDFRLELNSSFAAPLAFVTPSQLVSFASMGADESRGTSFWFSIGGWVALAALLGYVVRTMRKATPIGHPHLVTEFREVWNRKGERFSLHADLPRLSRKVYIHTHDGKTLEPPQGAVAAIKHVILGLSEQLFGNSAMSTKMEEIKVALDASFPDGQDEHADLQMAVKDFLAKNAELLGDSLMGLLKTLTQDIVAPGVIQMKRQLSPQMPYKDKRGEWYIHISFQDKDTIMVSHQKREQSFGHAEGQEFEFQWNLDLIFDRRVTSLMASALYIPVVDFGNSASEDTKSRVLLQLDDYTRL